MEPDVRKEILQRITAIEHPPRSALSRRYPFLKPIIIGTRRNSRTVQNLFSIRIARKRSTETFTHVIARHQSLLLRKLGTSDPRLQRNKIQNLRSAIPKLNGLILQPREVLSFWHAIGRPTRKKGYTDGMLLSGGRVIEGVGGGLCQLSNFLFWLFLHADTKIIERHHHSYDVFPDEGRVLPFGSGATVLFNFVDLKMQNTGEHPLQLKLWLTDKHLKGQLVSDAPAAKKYHVFEKCHAFIRRGKRYFRYNELWRECRTKDGETTEEKIATNCAPVLYDIDEEILRKNGQDIVIL